jgi:hypothetical protein
MLLSLGIVFGLQLLLRRAFERRLNAQMGMGMGMGEDADSRDLENRDPPVPDKGMPLAKPQIEDLQSSQDGR